MLVVYMHTYLVGKYSSTLIMQGLFYLPKLSRLMSIPFLDPTLLVPYSKVVLYLYNYCIFCSPWLFNL